MMFMYYIDLAGLIALAAVIVWQLVVSFQVWHKMRRKP